MQHLIDVDTETAWLLNQLAKLRHATSVEVVKEVVLASARRAGLQPRTGARLPPEERMRRALEGLKAIPQRSTDDNRPHEEIIGNDEHGLP